MTELWITRQRFLSVICCQKTESPPPMISCDFAVDAMMVVPTMTSNPRNSLMIESHQGALCCTTSLFLISGVRSLNFKNCDPCGSFVRQCFMDGAFAWHRSATGDTLHDHWSNKAELHPSVKPALGCALEASVGCLCMMPVGEIELCQNGVAKCDSRAERLLQNPTHPGGNQAPHALTECHGEG